jgi:hypothetical protein
MCQRKSASPQRPVANRALKVNAVKNGWSPTIMTALHGATNRHKGTEREQKPASLDERQ